MSDASLGCRDTLWVPGTLRTSCDRLILMEQSAEPVTPPRPQRNQLRAVAEQLAQLPLLRGGDGSLGQLAHPQQIHRLCCVG
jgi:hypothetical protein